MLKNKKVVADRDIPSLRGVLEPYFSEVEYLAGRDITREVAKDAEVLIIRTRTKVNRELLEGSSVELVVTATIGTDHIDLDYCRESGREVASAAGCNARGVASWVLRALYELGERGVIDTSQRLTLGIIGVGNVGSQLAMMAQKRGYEVLLNDPPRELKEGSEGFVELDYLLANSDIVTIHTPLNDTTLGLVNQDFLQKFRAPNKKKVLLNSSRGEVVCQEDLKSFLVLDTQLNFVGDVWCNEPEIDRELLNFAKIATPHIAGYSARGKARATSMSVQSVARFMGIEELKSWDCSLGYREEEPENFDILSYDERLRHDPDSFEAQRVIYDC